MFRSASSYGKVWPEATASPGSSRPSRSQCVPSGEAEGRTGAGGSRRRLLREVGPNATVCTSSRSTVMRRSNAMTNPRIPKLVGRLSIGEPRRRSQDSSAILAAAFIIVAHDHRIGLAQSGVRLGHLHDIACASHTSNTMKQCFAQHTDASRRDKVYKHGAQPSCIFVRRRFALVRIPAGGS